MLQVDYSNNDTHVFILGTAELYEVVQDPIEVYIHINFYQILSKLRQVQKCIESYNKGCMQ